MKIGDLVKDLFLSSLESEKFSIIMFDRYGMYANEVAELVEHFRSNAVVIVETKHETGSVSKFYECSVSYDEEGIKVVEWID